MDSASQIKIQSSSTHACWVTHGVPPNKTRNGSQDEWYGDDTTPIPLFLKGKQHLLLLNKMFWTLRTYNNNMWKIKINILYNFVIQKCQFNLWKQTTLNYQLKNIADQCWIFWVHKNGRINLCCPFSLQRHQKLRVYADIVWKFLFLLQ